MPPLSQTAHLGGQLNMRADLWMAWLKEVFGRINLRQQQRNLWTQIESRKIKFLFFQKKKKIQEFLIPLRVQKCDRQSANQKRHGGWDSENAKQIFLTTGRPQQVLWISSRWSWHRRCAGPGPGCREIHSSLFPGSLLYPEEAHPCMFYFLGSRLTHWD